MARRKKPKRWSYIAGEPGRNWVRGFEHWRTGAYYLEWYEDAPGTDPETGEPTTTRKRRRTKLSAQDQTEDQAKVKVDELAARFAALQGDPEAPATLTRLIHDYLQEVTPTKSKQKQGHDRRAARVWTAFFGAQPEVARHTDRPAASLDRLDWDRFIEWRSEGLIPGWGRRVKDRQVQYDLKWLIAVLNWGAGTRRPDNGEFYLPAGVSPWRPELRRAQRWHMPRERTPVRKSMTPEIREALIPHAPSWQFELALKLGRDSRSRNASVRRLMWPDIDLDAGTVRWRGENDKSGREAVTPILDPEVIDALRRAPSRGIGEVPVFPSATDPTQPTPRNTFQTWLRRAKHRFLRSIEDDRERGRWREQLRGVGFHAEKRAGVREPEFRALPPKVQESISRTDYETLRSVYDDLSADEMREAYRTQKRATGGAP